MQPVHIIYIDHKPIFFSLSDQYQRYSFKIPRGKHKVKLRTSNKEVEFTVSLKPNCKNITSVNLDKPAENIRITKTSSSYTRYEERMINKYLITLNKKYTNGYIEQGNQVYWLDDKAYSWKREFKVGPVLPREARFKVYKDYSINFLAEPAYTYEFKPGLIKMKNLYHDLQGNYIQNNLGQNQSIYDFHFGEQELLKELERRKGENQVSFQPERYPNKTSASNGRIKLLIPPGTFNKNRRIKNILLFKDKNPDFLNIYQGRSRVIHDLEPGTYSLIAILFDNQYLEHKHLKVIKNAVTCIQFIEKKIKKSDSTTDNINELLEKYYNEAYHVRTPYSENENKKQIKELYLERSRINLDNAVEISGFVYDANEGEPLPGVNVIAKGTSIGTVTDIEGAYSLLVPSQVSHLTFTYVGYVTEEIPVGVSQFIDAELHPDIQQLSEVVVVGYGVSEKRKLTSSVNTVSSSGFTGKLQGKAAGVMIRGIASLNAENQPLYVIDGIVYSQEQLKDLDPSTFTSIEQLKGSAATAIYGSRGANGVVLISTKSGSKSSVNKFIDNAFEMTGGQQMNSIRSNFRDYAFWHPKLTTDKNGVAKFSVTFPDDVTSWRSFVLAMNGQHQTGQVETEIKSFKPLMGTLSTPRFLVDGDISFMIGKGLNYTSDTFSIVAQHKVNGTPVFEKPYQITTSVIDTLKVTGDISQNDSVTVSYIVKKKDGYFDGEERSIPVFPKGSLEATGKFYNLQGDTTIEIAVQKQKNVEIQANASILEELIKEIEQVKAYPYDCNEQAASKLKVLLIEKNIRSYLKQNFNSEKMIKKLIKKLMDAQSPDGFWGWWPESETSYWISHHVLSALTEADKAGYHVDFRNKSMIIDDLVWQLNNKNIGWNDKVTYLQILHQLDSGINMKSFINELENDSLKQSISDHLDIILLKQMTSQIYDLKMLKDSVKQTIYGNYYWCNGIHKVFDNQVLTTLKAYRVLKNADEKQDYLSKIRNYLLEEKRTGYWRNTYESARILETILPDLISAGRLYRKPSIISGDNSKEITQFPFYQKMSLDKPLQITKKGSAPVYFSVFERKWNPDPQPVDSLFEISTLFDHKGNDLIAGKKVTLNVKLKVKKQADFVMIEVPVPAGCSYENKQQFYGVEVHREYRREKVSIFCQHLKEGDYEFKVELLPRYSGNYTVNPAKAEQMYFPVFYGRNQVKKATIK